MIVPGFTVILSRYLLIVPRIVYQQAVITGEGKENFVDIGMGPYCQNCKFLEREFR